MNLLPRWVLTDKFPAFYDSESKTAIEQTARVYGAMQELITEYNEFVDSVNQHILDFENAAKKDYEIFTTAIRQEFQDFIDVVTLKIQSQDSIIADAVSYMKTNLSESIDAALLEMRASGGFSQEVLKVYADMENQIAALNSRMNTFTTLEEGSTTGDAELQDGRTDYTGKTWDNIGSHIRGVTSRFADSIENISNTLTNTVNTFYDFVSSGNADAFALDTVIPAGTTIFDIYVKNASGYKNTTVYIFNADTYELMDTLLINYNETTAINKTYDCNVMLGGFAGVSYCITSDSSNGTLNRFISFSIADNVISLSYSGAANTMVYGITLNTSVIQKMNEDIKILHDTLTRESVIYKSSEAANYNVASMGSVYIPDVNSEISGGCKVSVTRTHNINTTFYLFEKTNDGFLCIDKINSKKDAIFDLSDYSHDRRFVIGCSGGRYSSKSSATEEEIAAGTFPTTLYQYDGTIEKESVYSFAKINVNFNFHYTVTVIESFDFDNLERYLNIGVSEGKRVLTVAKDGTGNFSTINAAMNFADSYMSRENEVTIIVYPGTYDEVVNALGGRFISIVGVNRETCILRNDSGVYTNCPLRIQGNSYIANLTLISTHKNNANFIKDGILQVNPSYALHIDDRHADNDDDYVCTVHNCKMYSEQNPAVGIGLDKNQTVNLIDCEIITNRTEDMLQLSGTVSNLWAHKPNGGALFYHALYSGNYTNDEGYQKLVVRNCMLKNNANNVVFGEPGGMEEQVELTFINNSGWAANGAAFVKGLANATLSPLSHGNNMDSMNYAE